MKNIFQGNSNIDKTAIMNWRTQKYDCVGNMIVIADGFMKSSLLVSEKYILENDHKEADVAIFPILFNANHAIELYLKSIVWTLNILLDNNKKIEGNHNIKQIFSVCNSKVSEYETSDERKNQYNAMTYNLKLYLDELFSKIEIVKENGRSEFGTDFSRYPFSNKYTNHFYIDEFNNVEVDLENFYTRFKEISKNLRLIASEYLEHVDLKNETASDY